MDKYDLDRFIQAQVVNYADAMAELQNGKKVSHWMWYVFPQLQGLGHSPMSHRYAINGENEARAYLEHPVLGQRLLECATVVLNIVDGSAQDIFGSPDDLKLRSSATLFARVSKDPVFQQILDKYFNGKPDDKTLKLLGQSPRT